MKKILLHIAISVTMTAALAGTMIQFIKTNGYVTIDICESTPNTVGVHLWMFDGTTTGVDLDMKIDYNSCLNIHHHSESIVPFNGLKIEEILNNKRAYYLKYKNQFKKH